MAITEEKTVTVADARAVGKRIKVDVARELSVSESKELRKLLKQAEASAQCVRAHDPWGGFIRSPLFGQ